MPSPIAHSTMGYIIYRIYRSRLPQQDTSKGPPLPRLLLVTGGLSLLPDLDVIPGILVGDINRFHNNLTHSLTFGLIVALAMGGAMLLKQHAGFMRWFLIVLICYELHVIMDYFTIGRGVMILWPFSAERYEPAVKLFYGLRRSDGWFSVQHLWTLVNELGFVVVVGFIVQILSKRKRHQPAPLADHKLYRRDS